MTAALAREPWVTQSPHHTRHMGAQKRVIVQREYRHVVLRTILQSYVFVESVYLVVDSHRNVRCKVIRSTA